MQASFSSLLSLVGRGGGRGRGGGGGRMGAIISITRYLPCHQCLLCVYLADHQTSPGCNSKVLHTTISFVNRFLQTDVVSCSLLGVHTPPLGSPQTPCTVFCSPFAISTFSFLWATTACRAKVCYLVRIVDFYIKVNQ